MLSLWLISIAAYTAFGAVTPWHYDPSTVCEKTLVDKLDGRAKNLNFDPIFIDSKKGIRIPVFTTINRANTRAIFRHQYDAESHGQFGAKAVAAKTLLGFRVVWFFPTGEGMHSFNVHHRDALGAITQYYGKMGYEWITSVNEMAAQMNERHPDKFPPPDDLSILDKYLLMQEGLDGMGEAYDKGGAYLATRGTNRDAADDPWLSHLLSEAQGFQLTAEYQNGELVVTHVEIDSAITNFQIHHQVPLDPDLQAELLNLTISSIGKKVRRFDPPKWPSTLHFIE